MARRWIKLWVAESLRGTIRFDFSSEERGVWYDLLIMAGDCREDGYIAPGEDRGYPLEWIAGALNIPLKLLERVLKKCVDTDRIEMTDKGVLIKNWTKYQSEYDRQKKYRGKDDAIPDTKQPF